jgi:hypothetical protein
MKSITTQQVYNDFSGHKDVLRKPKIVTAELKTHSGQQVVEVEIKHWPETGGGEQVNPFVNKKDGGADYSSVNKNSDPSDISVHFKVSLQVDEFIKKYPAGTKFDNKRLGQLAETLHSVNEQKETNNVPRENGANNFLAVHRARTDKSGELQK